MQMKIQRKKPQMFNDGILSIYSVINEACAGNMPKKALVPKVEGLRYSNRTVGMSRYWTAKQYQVEIARLVRAPLMDKVSTQDVCVIGEQQYTIEQVQYPEDVIPPCMDLSLSKVVDKYGLPGY